jgi:hypothetical protein
MTSGKDDSKSETGTNLNQEMSRIEEKILGVTLPEGITRERIHQSTVRILNILGKKTHRVWGTGKIWIRHVNNVRGIIQM